MRNLATAAVLAATIVAAGAAGHPAPVQPLSLDRILADYVAGRHDVVTANFNSSRDYRSRRLVDRGFMTRWLGEWNRGKAALLIELAQRSRAVAPAFSIPLLTTGRDYVLRRSPTRSSTDDEEFEGQWHRIAIGLLHQWRMWDETDVYLAALQRIRQPSDPAGSDGMLALGGAIALEQRCWQTRPELSRPAAVLDDLVRQSGHAAAGVNRPTRSQRDIDALARGECLAETLRRFASAAAFTDGRPEALVRSGWVLIQAGRPAEALASLDTVEPGDDRWLTYLTKLFSGRAHAALGRFDDAERSYRSALDVYPEAQAAGIGLALVLLRADRDKDADAVAQHVRSRGASADDPWLAYYDGSARFLDVWIAALRQRR